MGRKPVLFGVRQTSGGFPALPLAENQDQVRLMLRAMLEERFHLQLHAADHQGRFYFLEVGKGGFKFKNVPPPTPPDKEGPISVLMGDVGGRITGKKSTITVWPRCFRWTSDAPWSTGLGLKAGTIST